MNTLSAYVRLSAAIAIAAATQASAMAQTMMKAPVRFGPSDGSAPIRGSLKTPALIADDWLSSSDLEYWQIQLGGSHTPRKLSGPLFGPAAYPSLVAHGDVVIAASGTRVGANEPTVLLYNVITKSKRVLPNPYGPPIDVAIGKDSSLYVLNRMNFEPSNVAWYPQGSPPARKLVCRSMMAGEYIAVDNEGDIFVEGADAKNRNAVVEIPVGRSGPQLDHCMRLPLVFVSNAYLNGVAIDPKTDDLITLEDPGDCASSTPLMRIYPKPYSRKNVTSTYLQGICTNGPIRLNADSTTVFYSDVNYSFTGQIDAAAYPSGSSMGAYWDPNNPSPAGFTTIPNTLPN